VEATSGAGIRYVRELSRQLKSSSTRSDRSSTVTTAFPVNQHDEARTKNCCDCLGSPSYDGWCRVAYAQPGVKPLKRWLCGVVTLGVLMFLATSVLRSQQEWRWFRPSLQSEVRQLSQKEATELLSEFCRAEPRPVKDIGLDCSVGPLGSAFPDIVDATFHAQGVIFGHFLDAGSDEAALSGWSVETHPDRWGGTLLLSRRDGKWIPLWYKSALITRSCQKVSLPNRRDLLLCEDEDGGMGHQFHYLYSVDLENPTDLTHRLFTEAHSFNDGCAMQQQVMDAVQSTPDKRTFSVVTRTPEFNGFRIAPHERSVHRAGWL
jgi:hypothetical protein